MFEKAVIIVAGGSGSRMKTSVPKQFLKLGDAPILVHTVKRFHEFDPAMQIVLVLPEEHIHIWEEIAIEFGIAFKIDVVVGGATRYQSVQNGMKATRKEGVIGIHDGVRPLVSEETLIRCYKQAFLDGNAIPSMPVEETLREVDGKNSLWVDRSRYRTIQTPQCFKAELIDDAYHQDYDPSFTDDASVVEARGVQIHLVEGNRENIKITRPEDLRIAELLMNADEE